MVPAVSLLINHFDLFGTRQVWLHLRGREYTQLPFRTPMLYRFVRHPLYVGWLTAFWATPTMTRGAPALRGLMSAYIFIAIPFEERNLIHTSAAQYADYRHARRRADSASPWRLEAQHDGRRATHQRSQLISLFARSHARPAYTRLNAMHARSAIRPSPAAQVVPGGGTFVLSAGWRSGGLASISPPPAVPGAYAPGSRRCSKGDVSELQATRSAADSGQLTRADLEEALRLSLLYHREGHLRQLLFDGVDPNAANESGHTALMILAARADSIPMARMLIDAGADWTPQTSRTNRADECRRRRAGSEWSAFLLGQGARVQADRCARPRSVRSDKQRRRCPDPAGSSGRKRKNFPLARKDRGRRAYRQRNSAAKETSMRSSIGRWMGLMVLMLSVTACADPPRRPLHRSRRRLPRRRDGARRSSALIRTPALESATCPWSGSKSRSCSMRRWKSSAAPSRVQLRHRPRSRRRQKLSDHPGDDAKNVTVGQFLQFIQGRSPACNTSGSTGPMDRFYAIRVAWKTIPSAGRWAIDRNRVRLFRLNEFINTLADENPAKDKPREEKVKEATAQVLSLLQAALEQTEDQEPCVVKIHEPTLTLMFKGGPEKQAVLERSAVRVDAGRKFKHRPFGPALVNRGPKWNIVSKISTRPQR